MADDVIFERSQQIGFITLNRAGALNALTLPMIQAMYQKLSTWQEDDTIAAVVLRAMPGKAFCAGGDIRWLYEAGKANNPEQMDFFKHEYRLNHFISCFRKPYIALMDGMTMGGGVGISLHGSHPVATEQFLFAMPETSIGFFPDIGASYLLSRCANAIGIYLGLTGCRLNQGESVSAGLIKHTIAAQQIEVMLDELQNTDLTHQAHHQVDTILGRFTASLDTDDSLKNKDNISHFFSANTIEEIFTELEVGNSAWHKDMLAILQSKSPLSLKVTLAQIQKAAHLSLSECLETDYCLVRHFMQHPDFYEGVRALLIDKDKAPKWQLETISEVSQDLVDSFFSCQDNLQFNHQGR